MLIVIVTAMYVYSFLLFVKEITQLLDEIRRSHDNSPRMYFKNGNNWVDLLIINFTVLVATLLLIKVNSGDDKSMPWLGNFISIAILTTWFHFCKELLCCLPIPGVAQNLNMFQHVSKTYLAIYACFAPFLLAFAHTFKGYKNKSFSLLNCEIKVTFNFSHCELRRGICRDLHRCNF